MIQVKLTNKKGESAFSYLDETTFEYVNRNPEDAIMEVSRLAFDVGAVAMDSELVSIETDFKRDKDITADILFHNEGLKYFNIAFFNKVYIADYTLEKIASEILQNPQYREWFEKAIEGLTKTVFLDVNLCGIFNKITELQKEYLQLVTKMKDKLNFKPDQGE